MVRIEQWLADLGLGCYVRVFADNDIDLDVLPELSDGDFKSLGVSLGHRRRLAVAIGALRRARLPDSEASARNRVEEARGEGYVGEAERRQLTIMICDLAGFVALSERLDPEELREILSAYQAESTAAIENFGGTVTRYMGDGILAHFGYPRAHEDDAGRAVLAGLGVLEALSNVNDTVCRGKGVQLAVRVGIATGTVVVGDLIGKGAAEESAVIGPTANLADRLQELAEPDSVLVSPTTRRLAGGGFRYRDLGKRAVKGITEPVQIWQVTGKRPLTTRFEADRGSSLTPLVGRSEEVDLLVRRWERVRDGEGQVVLISGEPGIGKSRIAQALRERIRDEHHTLLCFQCSSYHTNSALHPITAQLEAAARFSAEDSPTQKRFKLEAFLGESGNDTEHDLPYLAALLSLPLESRGSEALELESKRRKEATLAVLSRQLEGSSNRLPVLCIFEDMQWVDPSTLDLLNDWVERVRDLRVLMVMTFRTEFDPPWAGAAHTSFMSLSRMDRRESAELVRRVAAGKSLPPEVLEPILSKTDGVPLYVEEFTKTVLESQLLRDAGDHYELSEPLPPLAIPASLRDSLAARLDRLESVKELAQLAAVIGRTFSHRVLAAVSELPENDLEGALDRLIQSELVYKRDTQPDVTYEFKHALVQEEAYTSLLREKRRKLHTRIARVLEEQFPETAEIQPELLAHHYQEAGKTEEAIEYWLRAGQRSARRSDYLEAREQLQKALPLLRAQPPSPARTRKELEIHLALGAALAGSGAFSAPAAGMAYRRALELCAELGDPPEVFPVLSGAGSFYVTAGEFGEALRCARDCLAKAQRQGSIVGRVIGHRLMGGTLFLTGELAAARAELDTVLALIADEPTRYAKAKEAYTQDHKSTALCYMSLTMTSMGLVDSGLKTALSSLQNAESHGNPHTINYVACFLAAVHHLRRDDGDALRVATRSRDMAIEHGFGSWVGISRIVRGEALTRSGHQDEGLAEITRGLDAHRKINARTYLPFALSLNAKALMTVNRPREALASLDEALDLVADTGERWYLAELYRLQGVALGRVQNEAEAEQRLMQALETAEVTGARQWWLRALMDLARLIGNRGRGRDVFERLTEFCSGIEEGHGTPDFREARDLLDGTPGRH